MLQGILVAFARVVLGAAFLLFGASKVILADAYGGQSFVEFFPQFVKQSLEGQPYPFWRPFLEHVVAPHAFWFAWAVAVGEMLLGVFLLLGLWTRLVSIFGIALMASIHFCKNPFAGPGPLANQVGAALQHLAVALLLLTFVAVGAGAFALDGRKKKAKSETKEKGE